MLTVTFNELEVNAVLAALDGRVAAMSRQLHILKEQRDSPDNAFAVDATNAAIRHAMSAQGAISAQLPDSEHSDDYDYFGLDREGQPEFNGAFR